MNGSIRKRLLQRQWSHYDPDVEGVTLRVARLDPEVKECVNGHDGDDCQQSSFCGEKLPGKGGEYEKLRMLKKRYDIMDSKSVLKKKKKKKIILIERWYHSATGRLRTKSCYQMAFVCSTIATTSGRKGTMYQDQLAVENLSRMSYIPV